MFKLRSKGETAMSIQKIAVIADEGLSKKEIYDLANTLASNGLKVDSVLPDIHALFGWVDVDASGKQLNELACVEGVIGIEPDSSVSIAPPEGNRPC